MLYLCTENTEKKGGDVLAVCPKCGVEIKRFDLAPNCKKCGVNIYYYSQEKVLSTDAKRTELESADARALVARIKGNFIGGKVQIARIVFMVLAIAVMCIPYFTIKIKLPMSEIGFSTGIVGVYQIVSNSVYSIFPALFKVRLGGDLTTATVVNMALFIVVALILVAMLVVMILSFLDIKKYAKILAGLSFAGIAADIAAFAAMLFARSCASGNGLSGITVSFAFGSLASIAMLLVFAILNLKLAKTGVEIVTSEVDKKRIELYKQYKAGTLDLDTLPLPIFETDEEREKRENMIAGGKKKKKDKKKEAKKDG